MQKFEKEAMKELEQKNSTKKGKKDKLEFTQLKVFEHYQLDQYIPENAQIIIYQLLQKDPRDRPSALDILSS